MNDVASLPEDAPVTFSPSGVMHTISGAQDAKVSEVVLVPLLRELYVYPSNYIFLSLGYETLISHNVSFINTG